MNILCLQCTEHYSVDAIIKKINEKKEFLPQKPETVTERKKLVLRGKKTLVERHYRRQLFKLGRGWTFVTVWIEEGSIVADSCILLQRDIYISYPSKVLYKVSKLIEYLLSVLSLIMVEPEPWERLKQAQASFNPQTLPQYKPKNIKSGLLCHLPWQLYAVNFLWARFIDNPAERVVVRQLRVKVRRLRSCLSFFKPALKQDECQKCQNILRAQGESIGRLREIDVILMGLERLRQDAAGKDRGKLLNEYFIAAKAEAVETLKQEYSLRKATWELVQIMLWLQGQSVSPTYGAVLLQKFLWRRLDKWSDNIMTLTERYPNFANMPETHKIRIKVKRFRYVLMCLPELNKGTENMLRKLKRLQDMLGFLHDEYINGLLVRQIQAKDDDALAYEITLFTGWESAKVASYIGALDALWEDFCDELKAWHK